MAAVTDTTQVDSLAKKYGFKHKPKIKVMDIGPDPPLLYRKYIWGRDCLFTFLK